MQAHFQLLYAIEALERESAMSHKEGNALRIGVNHCVSGPIKVNISFKTWMAVTPQSPIGKALSNIVPSGGISLHNILTDGMLEIDSNQIENFIRPLALGRKNYLFAGSFTMLGKILTCSIAFLKNVPIERRSTPKNS